MKNDTIIIVTKYIEHDDIKLIITKPFPINLITKIINRENRILDISGGHRIYSFWKYYIITREATQKEKFLFYVNNEIPFVLKE